jgi:hypothetical protein
VSSNNILYASSNFLQNNLGISSRLTVLNINLEYKTLQSISFPLSFGLFTWYSSPSTAIQA